MPLKTTKTLCSTKEAAKIFGCTMGRIRQMARAKVIWSQHLTERALVLDLEEIKTKAKKPAPTGRPRKNRPSLEAWK